MQDLYEENYYKTLPKRVKEDAYVKKTTIFLNSWNFSNWKTVESWSSCLQRVDETPCRPFLRNAKSCWLALLWVPEELGPNGVVPRKWERGDTGSDDLCAMLVFCVSKLSNWQAAGWMWVVFQELFASSYDYLIFLGASFRQGWEALGVAPGCLRAGFGLSCGILALFPTFSSVW